ncbi:RNA-splicing ligase RtcB [Candidatus Berkelbacteria bacterium RBG_13_40_8]|uniref:tRNA-splicing ligase RtcB n=1 Tax=Candidatus Berkelbacteria bacterium RBG_13_40_8 TaxID=1797467 RepID=A0A1F5DPL9_9BACT|nr:MAG: RNA-splicing ligase RtcB [Candidatus Berkelbacteria bacterium RBG_13_40_8]
MQRDLKQIGPNHYRLKKTGRMLANVDLFLNKKLLEGVYQDRSIEQLINASELSGVISPVVGLPDIHEGYGLPIGGVMAQDSKNGVISAGAVGYDINCGVRLLRTNIKYEPKNIDTPFLRRLMNAIEKRIPTGIGTVGFHQDIDISLEEITKNGIRVLIDKGHGFPEDLESVEENGCLSGTDLSKVSEVAIRRGSKQLATLGGGNHFIEIQEISEIFDENLAKVFGLEKGNLSLMIHSGSRGFGHQICGDYINILMKGAERDKIYIPTRAIAAAKISSLEGRAYYSAMACAVNFAFSNRQMMAMDVRDAFSEVFGKSARELGMLTVYDVAHNIAKFEEYNGRKILIHRKGATRAFPAGHAMLSEKYKSTGHPAIVPGSMGTPSYVMVGTEKARESFYSINHGSGRAMSRKEASRKITEQEFKKAMDTILYNSRNWRLLIDEAPLAYKNIADVVDTLVEAGLAKKIAKMRPLAVIKGAGVEG